MPHPAAQSHVHVGLPAISRSDPDYFPLLVGNYTLGGGGFVSRLMKEVREKRGYAYSVYSYFAPHKLEGPFEIGLQTKREQADAALKVVDQVFDLVLSLRDQGITILLVEQNAERALDIANRGYVLQSGRLVLSGSGAELAGSDLIRQAYLAG